MDLFNNGGRSFGGNRRGWSKDRVIDDVTMLVDNSRIWWSDCTLTEAASLEHKKGVLTTLNTCHKCGSRGWSTSKVLAHAICLHASLYCIL